MVLGVIGSFDVEVLEQFEANISNKDSLTSCLDRTIKKTEDFSWRMTTVINFLRWLLPEVLLKVFTFLQDWLNRIQKICFPTDAKNLDSYPAYPGGIGSKEIGF